MARHSPHIFELARRGAQHRLEELQQEIAALTKHFPHLAPTARRGRTPQIDGSAEPAATIDRGPRRRRRMSAANRKAVSERMRNYWAARRAGKKR